MLQKLKVNAEMLTLWVTVLAACRSPAADLAAAVGPSLSRPVQPRSYRQMIWTTEQGLPNNTIQTLLQSRDGYLWIGTAAGLVRFDGLRFTVFQRRTHPAMVNDDCRALAQATDGSLWIGTANGLLRYSGGTFQRFTQELGLGDPTVRSLVASRQNEIWIAATKGLTRWRDGAFSLLLAPDKSNGSDGGDVFGLGEDADGTLWVSDNLGLRFFDRQMDRFRPHVLDRLFPEVAITAVFSPNTNVSWLASSSPQPFSNEVDFLCQCVEGQSTPFSSGKPSSHAGYLQFLVPDRVGNFWLSAGRFGLDCFRDGQFTRFTRADGLSDNWVICCCEDLEGNLWIGTEHGLNLWQPRRVIPYSVREGLVNDNAWTLCETRDGSVWIGTDAGLSRFKDSMITSYTEADGLAKNSVRSLAEGRDGDLWIGTGGGLDVFQVGAFTHLALPGELSGNKVRVVHKGQDGVMWVGAELGLHRFQEGKWTRWTMADGLSHNDVRAIHETRDGAVWIGTSGGGVCRLVYGVPPSGGQTLISSEPGESSLEPRHSQAPVRLKPGLQTFTTTNGLANNFGWAFHEDSEGALWIGTEGGLSRWKNGKVSSFTTEQGLLENVINEILEDDLGNLWLSGEEGIYRVARRDLEAIAEGRAHKVTVASFGAADGLLSIETNGQKSQPAGCKSRDGKLWFPTTKGVIAIDPRAGILNEVRPPVVIEQVRADDQVIYGDGIPTDARKLVSHSSFSILHSSLKLPPGRARVVEFHYTANSFVAPEHIHFRYRLEGHDRDWTDAGTRRVAYYTSLRPGDYRFRVAACNSHGIWNDTGASFALSLAPYFYETSWFYALCGLGVVGTAYGLHRLRLRVAYKFQALEQQLALEQERARIARDIHDNLGASLTQIGLWTEIASRNLEEPHPAVGHVRRVSSAARDAFDSLGEIVWAINPQNDTLSSLLAYLRNSVQEFVEAAGIKVQLDWPEKIPASSVTAEQRHQLFLVVKEALRNTVRHSAATQVCVSVKIENSRLCVLLRDNGRGFDTKSLPDSGNGLSNMAKRVAQINGQFLISSQPGRGTEIAIEIPLLPLPS